MSAILFLHGFYEIDPEATALLRAIRRLLPTHLILAPAYHPRGIVRETRLKVALAQCREAVLKAANSEAVYVVGFSFGGLLAALFAQQHPELVRRMLLFAPAIDNVDRNYRTLPPEQWRMPVEFVEELNRYPARPRFPHKTVLVHGLLDHDEGGCSPWRIERWATEQPFEQLHLLPETTHSLEPWLSAHTAAARPDWPSLHTLLSHLLDGAVEGYVYGSN